MIYRLSTCHFTDTPCAFCTLTPPLPTHYRRACCCALTACNTRPSRPSASHPALMPWLPCRLHRYSASYLATTARLYVFLPCLPSLPFSWVEAALSCFAARVTTLPTAYRTAHCLPATTARRAVLFCQTTAHCQPATPIPSSFPASEARFATTGRVTLTLQLCPPSLSGSHETTQQLTWHLLLPCKTSRTLLRRLHILLFWDTH